MLTAQEIASRIDQALLRPELTVDGVRAGCAAGRRHGVATVCVRPCDVSLAAEELAGSGVLVSTVIGFPHGANSTAVKAFEAETALAEGAAELDMVINISRLLARDLEFVEKEIKAVVEPAHTRGAAVKVILENCYLPDELKMEGCRLAERAGADYVKTSTGFGPGGATVDDLRLMRRACGPRMKIKAAGGMRNLDQVLAALAAGADRLGLSAVEDIMEEALRRELEGTLRLAEGGLGEGY